MRDIIVKAWLALLLVALAPGLASAAGLGRLTVLSALGQPLSAEIELVSVSKAEMGSLGARIAPPEAYRQANLQYNAALPGARVTIEKRPDGRPYLKITTSRPVVEPFIDLMVDLTWSSGRILRQYTALLDPPGVGSMPLGEAAPTVSVTPEMRPAPMVPEAPAAPLAPPSPPSPAVEAAPEPPVSAPVSRPIAPAPAPAAGAKEYGPIERGETLGKIARSVMPEDVTLEQMLVALYRANEDAFIRKNLNLVRAGKILRVPDREEVESISKGEAVTVYRTHVTDWRAYRQRLADAAGKTPAGSQSATRGKIVAKVEDNTGGGPKEVVKISKGEPPAAGEAKPRSTVERIRALEEEVVAREKALAEANDRIVQLEKTIKDMQKLIALRSSGMPSAQQQPEQAAPATPEPARPPVAAAAKPEVAQPPPAPEKPRVVAAPEPLKPKPKPKPKVVSPPSSPAQPELMDQVVEALGDPMYLAAGSGVLVLGGLALWMARRRRAREGVDIGLPREAPTLSSAAAAAAGVVASTDDMYSAATTGTPATPGAPDEVDPLAEAEVYIAYGRDGQAEEILKEALARAPNRADVKMKLLEIYAARKDRSAFGGLASDVQRQIGSSGGDWLKVAAMGYALDPHNKLYEAGKGAESPVQTGPRSGTNLDFDLGIGAGSPLTSTDIELDSEAAAAVQAATQTVVDTGMATDVGRTQRAAAAPLMPDFTLDVPPAGEKPAEADLKLEPGAPARETGTIDFQIELPPAAAAIHELPTVQEATSPGGADFKLEIPKGGLDLGGKPTPKPAQGIPTTKNGHWYDVQTKFDLAKAYQEMGDKAGAKEILEEVISEGDADQKSQAKALLDSLG